MGMETVIDLAAERHARTSASSEPISARASKVRPGTPRLLAKRAKLTQRDEGIPRERQRLTVDGCNDSASETAFVPPSESMTELAVTMDRNLVCGLQTCQGFAKRKATFGADYGAMGSMADQREVIFGRLESLRAELARLNPEAGFEVEGRFAATIGIHKTSWSQIKSFDRDFPLTAAFRLKERWNISLDWIYYGDQPASAQIMAKIGRGPIAELRPKAAPKRKAS